MTKAASGAARGVPASAGATIVRAIAALLAIVSMAACGSFGGDTPARAWYQLEDQRAAERQPAPALAKSVLIESVSASAIYDSTSLVFSRSPGELAYYQFAGWADRPAHRIGLLAERRLVARGLFPSVAASTAGVRGDLLLRLSLEEALHDTAASPGTARIALRAELIDWRERKLVARRAFAASEPVAREDAAGAVAAFNRALARLLDELAPWVEASAAGG